MTRNGFWKATLLAGSLLLFASRAGATVVTLEFTVSFGETPVGGTGPWITAEFDDNDSAGEVLLTIRTDGLLNGSMPPDAYPNVTELYFNFDADLTGDAILLEADDFTRLDSNDVTVLSLNVGDDAFRAGGDGLYDIWIDIQTGDQSMRLNPGETLEYRIEATGLTAMHFYDVSALASEGESNPGPFLAAAHVQSTGPDQLGSDWVAAVPIPAAIWLLASALAMLAVSVRRRRQLPQPA